MGVTSTTRDKWLLQFLGLWRGIVICFCEGPGHQTKITSTLRMHPKVDNEEGGTIFAVCKVIMYNVRSEKADLNGVSAERTGV